MNEVERNDSKITTDDDRSLVDELEKLAAEVSVVSERAKRYAVQKSVAAQRNVKQARSKVEEAVRQRPLTSMAVAGGAGVVLAVLLLNVRNSSRSRSRWPTLSHLHVPTRSELWDAGRSVGEYASSNLPSRSRLSSLIDDLVTAVSDDTTRNRLAGAGQRLFDLLNGLRQR